MRYLIVSIWILTMSQLAWTDSAPVPPVAPRMEHKEVRHGATVTDDYFWLREKSNPEVTRYLNAENAYTEAMTRSMQPFVDALYQEMLGHIKQTDLSVPTPFGGYYYYSRTEEGKQYPVRSRRKGSMEAPEQVLLDLNQLAGGRKFVELGGFAVSDDHNLLAYTTDFTGYRQYSLHVKDLRTGAMLPDTAELVSSLVWAADNKTLFLTTEDAVSKRSHKLWRYVLGTSKPEQLYEETDVLYSIYLRKTRDRKYVMLQIASSDTAEVRYLPASQPQHAFTVFLPREKGHRYYVDHREGTFYVRTDKDAKNFRLVTAPVNDPAPKNWKTFVPHRDDVQISGIDLFRDFAVVHEKSEALNRLRVYDFKTGVWTAIPFPEPVYSAVGSETPDFESIQYRYNYQSLVTPPSVYDYDTRTHTSTLLKQQEVPGGYDPKLYVSERQWATARDGVRVPLSIVYRKGFERNGKGPMLLYGYGSYGAGMPATFVSSRLALLDRGVAFAIAHIRGGDEMGQKWREDGKLMKKKNTFLDFIDSAEYLIEQKWTSRNRLAIEGGSAGGLLMGAVVNLRPDLFRAVHLAVPWVDVMNDMLDASLPLTTNEYLEWGNPSEKSAYDYMLSYSPYENIRKTAYPAMLVTESLNDSQVMYWGAAKWVARMRVLKTDSNVLLLKMKMDPAGHGGASGRYDQLKDRAFETAWLLTQLGITR